MSVSTSTLHANNTVYFNVGGMIYEVCRSLLEMHPNTMLARLASEIWSPDGSNGNGDDDGGGNIKKEDKSVCGGDGEKNDDDASIGMRTKIDNTPINRKQLI